MLLKALPRQPEQGLGQRSQDRREKTRHPRLIMPRVTHCHDSQNTLGGRRSRARQTGQRNIPPEQAEEGLRMAF